MVMINARIAPFGTLAGSTMINICYTTPLYLASSASRGVQINDTSTPARRLARVTAAAGELDIARNQDNRFTHQLDKHRAT